MAINVKRVAVLVSGGGSNLQALIDGIEEQSIPAEIVLVVANKPGIFALERAARHKIPTAVFPHKDYQSPEEYGRILRRRLEKEKVDLVCLAGFTIILDPVFLAAFPNRIINIHPSLLPAFGGRGMYGLHVHRAVLASGAKYSGATVHIVTAEIDQGPIICQEIVPVQDNDTPETLAARVLEVEHRIYPRALKLMAEEAIEIDGLRTRIKKREKNL